MKLSFAKSIASFILILTSQVTPAFQSNAYSLTEAAYMPDLGFEGFIDQITGRYARVVKLHYHDGKPFKLGTSSLETFGFTDIYVADGQLRSRESFCRARYTDDLKIKRVFVDDIEMRNIQSLPEDLFILKQDGNFSLKRPTSAILIGASFQDELYEPFIVNPLDLRVRLSQKDRKPGIEALVYAFGAAISRIRIARREVFSYQATWQENGSFLGYVDATSEQFILSSEPQLRSRFSASSIAFADSKKSTIELTPSPADSTCSLFDLQTSQSSNE